MNKKEKAIKNFETLNCNQSVLAAFGPGFGVDEKLCLKLGLGFGGGMARQGKTCGVVTGAYLVIGLWSAEQSKDKTEIKKIAYDKIEEFNQRFTAIHENTECKSLLKYDMSIPEEAQKIEMLGLTEKICPILVGSSAEILEDILT